MLNFLRYFQNVFQQNGFVPIEDDVEGSGEGSGGEPDDEDDGDGLSIGAIVGITIGALVGVGILFFILRKFCCRSSKKTENESADVYMTTNEAFDDPRDDLDGEDQGAGADNGGTDASN